MAGCVRDILRNVPISEVVGPPTCAQFRLLNTKKAAKCQQERANDHKNPKTPHPTQQQLTKHHRTSALLHPQCLTRCYLRMRNGQNKRRHQPTRKPFRTKSRTNRRNRTILRLLPTPQRCQNAVRRTRPHRHLFKT